MIELLIKRGANNFNEVMCRACKSGRLDIVKIMIPERANHFELMIHCKAKDLNTALHIACNNHHFHIIQLLLNNGANDFDSVLA